MKRGITIKKRQRKKNQKKYLPIHADEAILLTMTEEEQKKAWNDYLKYRERYAYCKTYRELKEFKKNNKRKMLFYSYPIGEKMSNYLQKVSSLGRRNSKNFATQSLTEEEKQEIQKVLNEK